MKGSGIVFDNARRTATESFPPASLGGSFIAVFVGCDAEIEQGVFGKINAVEFAEDAKILQEVKSMPALIWTKESLPHGRRTARHLILSWNAALRFLKARTLLPTPQAPWARRK